ncbi:S8 family serine peptidase [Crossiella sp. CA-258035]|uniref:S8 family peptidase n=1 Tax=Crossiella sp. CA-258035 TaxID=2981138 RepID=UPI0024BC39D5|nr:S8 family peptidase [Crossiella sp. CA-258035]WHT23245.1 S8 family serine peptidase [Crossiella sp. CA-258035]
MHTKAQALLALGLLAPALTLGATAAQAAPAEGTVVQARQHYGDQYIVVLREDVATGQAASAALAQRYGGELRSTYTHTLRGFSVRSMTEQQARRLAADPAVKSVHQDGTARGADTQPNPTWGLDRVDQKNLPLDRAYTYPNTGEGVTAYDIDSGIDPGNPEYEGRASLGKDFFGGNGYDCHGHGSHTAGTMGSKTYGVAKKIKVVGLKVLGCDNTGPDSGIIDAVEWVTANARKPAVANMSLTMDAPGVGDDAVKASVASGVVYTVAAGNASSDACGTSPARVPEVITVGGTNSSDNRYMGSNIGTCLDIFAPGENVTSISKGNSGGGSTNMTGTSMAAPHVGGAAALYLAANPGATPQQVRDALVNGATDGVIRNVGNGSPNKLLNVSAISGGPGPKCGIRTNITPVPIPDAGDAVTSSVTQEGCPGTASATLPVKVDISHAYTADLVLDLIGPSGKSYRLKDSGGIGSAGGVHQSFTVDASSENANGTWKLSARDVYRFDAGTIEGFAITF